MQFPLFRLFATALLVTAQNWLTSSVQDVVGEVYYGAVITCGEAVCVRQGLHAGKACAEVLEQALQQRNRYDCRCRIALQVPALLT